MGGGATKPTECFVETSLGFGKSKGSDRENQNTPPWTTLHSISAVCLDKAKFVRDGMTKLLTFSAATLARGG